MRPSLTQLRQQFLEDVINLSEDDSPEFLQKALTVTRKLDIEFTKLLEASNRKQFNKARNKAP